jgi:hypothetical protein
VHLLFADDAELMAESELELQHILNVFAEVVSAHGQEISVRKTEVLVVQPRDTRCHVEEPYRMQVEADDTNKKVGTISVYGMLNWQKAFLRMQDLNSTQDIRRLLVL